MRSREEREQDFEEVKTPLMDDQASTFPYLSMKRGPYELHPDADPLVVCSIFEHQDFIEQKSEFFKTHRLALLWKRAILIVQYSFLFRWFKLWSLDFRKNRQSLLLRYVCESCLVPHRNESGKIMNYCDRCSSIDGGEIFYSQFDEEWSPLWCDDGGKKPILGFEDYRY